MNNPNKNQTEKKIRSYAPSSYKKFCEASDYEPHN